MASRSEPSVGPAIACYYALARAVEPERFGGQRAERPGKDDEWRSGMLRAMHDADALATLDTLADKLYGGSRGQYLTGAAPVSPLWRAIARSATEGAVEGSEAV